jgi:hypothetical protein
MAPIPQWTANLPRFENDAYNRRMLERNSLKSSGLDGGDGWNSGYLIKAGLIHRIDDANFYLWHIANLPLLFCCFRRSASDLPVTINDVEEAYDVLQHRSGPDRVKIKLPLATQMDQARGSHQG